MKAPSTTMLPSSTAKCHVGQLPRGCVRGLPAFVASPHCTSAWLNSPRFGQSPICLASSTDDVEFEFDASIQGQPLVASQSATSYDLPEDDPDSRALAVSLAKVCWETKGEHVCVLHVAPLVYWTRYMIIATVFSRPQLQAILAKVEKEAEEKHDRRAAAPASGRSAWELLDFGDVVVHVLTAEQRDYYDLESFYGAAEELDLPFLKESNQAPAWETKL